MSGIFNKAFALEQVSEETDILHSPGSKRNSTDQKSCSGIHKPGINILNDHSMERRSTDISPARCMTDQSDERNMADQSKPITTDQSVGRFAREQTEASIGMSFDVFSSVGEDIEMMSIDV